MKKKIFIAAAVAVLLIIMSLILYRIVLGAKAPKVVPGLNNNEQALIMAHAEKALMEGDPLRAKELYQQAIEKFPNSGNILKIQEALDDVNMKILFSPAISSDSVLYEVRKGDTLNKIAKQFGTTIELISKANNLKDNNIRFGQKLKISKARFNITVSKSRNVLTLKSNQDILKTYAVSTGKNSSTPVGNFKITNKLVNPLWYPSSGGVIPAGDPKNVLGSRWMGISKQGYGIHGTTEPESIGKSVTEGCVRMKNSDVEELYAIVPEGTEVTITD